METYRCIDGNEAACYVAYGLSEVAFIFPITPSSPMAELADVWATEGRKGAFDQVLNITQMQGEGGAAGALHGAAQGGALCTTFTSSQGLLLMIPSVYKMAGELLPAVYHVSARSVSYCSHSIFGEHSDVMALRQTGAAMLCAGSVQEVMDLAVVAHAASLRASIPFIHFFDGFQTSHEVQKVKVIPYSSMKELIDEKAILRFHSKATTPYKPSMRGTLCGRDIYMQEIEATNSTREQSAGIVAEVMQALQTITKRQYNLFDYYGAPDADRVIVIMGSGAWSCREAVDFLQEKGENVGVVIVRLFRPWSTQHFLQTLPKTVRKIAVLDRSKEGCAIGEALYLDVIATIHDAGLETKVYGGRYGLGDKIFTPGMAKAVLDNLSSGKPIKSFSVGIIDDVTNRSLPFQPELDTIKPGTTQCVLWGFGSDGTVGVSTLAIKLIGENTDLYAQGRFFFSAHKAGGTTWSHLRFGTNPITSSYPVLSADYVGCHHASYVSRFPVLNFLKPSGGTFVLNCPWTVEELGSRLSPSFKKTLATKNPSFYIINANKISKEAGLGGFINVTMQTVFFKLAQVLPFEKAIGLLKDSVVKAYKKKGEAVIKKNHDAIDSSLAALVKVDIPSEWASITVPAESVAEELPEFVKKIKIPQTAMLGNKLPVSSFPTPGISPPGTSNFEKRGVATEVPVWHSDKCIQCNMCSMICPHAAIRPYLLSKDEVEKAPGKPAFLPAKGLGKDAPADLLFRVQVAPLDCTGCSQCSFVCPKAALEMRPIDESVGEAPIYNFLESLPKKDVLPKTTVKGVTFRKPLYEFAVACQGCGEGAYMRLLTQISPIALWSLPAGCASASVCIYGQNPMSTLPSGKGPAVSSALFEDGAETGLGLLTAHRTRRAALLTTVRTLLANSIEVVSPQLKEGLKLWVNDYEDRDKSVLHSDKLIPLLKTEKSKADIVESIFNNCEELIKPSSWVIGGDGWAYDIDFGGLDHVLSIGMDLKILVLDTEGYSNTGGQKSKGTPKGAVQKFAAGGYKVHKKDLAQIAIGYKHLYVAQVALNANPRQCLQAMLEAEAYPGTALILGYAACREQGIISRDWVAETKLAVDTGYWPLFRYNPSLKAEGRNPFQLDSKVSKPVKDFIAVENRFLRLQRDNPPVAEAMQSDLIEHIEARFKKLQRIGAGEIEL